MASIALMLGGALLNATAFIGGSYLAKTLSGKDAQKERVRHDKALEKYQHDYEAYQENRERVADWVREREKTEYKAGENLDNTDNAFELYNKVHDERSQLQNVEEPNFENYYKPSPNQKTGETVYVGGGMLALTYAASKWL